VEYVIGIWLSDVEENTNQAMCLLCKKKFSLSNMGMQAVTSHALGEKHKKVAKARKGSVLEFLLKPINVAENLT